MTKEKIVLAYSGGLDTSVSVKWIQEKYGYDVIALGLDVGELILAGLRIPISS